MIEKNANFQKMLSEKHYPWKRIKKREIWRDWYCNGPTTHMKEDALNECNTKFFGVPLIIYHLRIRWGKYYPFSTMNFFAVLNTASFLLSNPKYKKVFSIPKAAILFPGDNENKTSF